MTIGLPSLRSPFPRDAPSGPTHLALWEWPLVAVVALLLLRLLSHAPLATPYWWDAAAVYVPGSQWVRDHGFAAVPGVFPSLLGRGHTTLFYVITAGAFAIFGDSPAVGHLVVLGFSVAALVFTYALGTLLSGRLVGAMAAVLVAVAPLYLTISSMVLPEVPLTACTMAGLYAWARGRFVLAALAGVLVVLTKETGLACACAILGATVLWSWKARSWRWSSALYGAGVPMAVLLGFFIWQRAAEGWWVLPFHAELFGQARNYFWSGVTTFHSMALADGRFLVTGSAAVVLAARLWRAPETFGTYSPEEGAPPRWVVLVAIALVFLANQVFFTKMWFLERYALPAHPCLAILLAAALLPRVWWRERGWAVAGLVPIAGTVVLAVGSAFAGKGYDSGETTFRYMHMVEAHLDIFGELERRSEPPLVLTAWPMTDELRDPTLGWVERPFEAIGVTGYLDGTDTVRRGRAIDAIVTAEGLGHHEDLQRTARELGMERTRLAAVEGAVVELWEPASEEEAGLPPAVD